MWELPGNVHSLHTSTFPTGLLQGKELPWLDAHHQVKETGSIRACVWCPHFTFYLKGQIKSLSLGHTACNLQPIPLLALQLHLCSLELCIIFQYMFKILGQILNLCSPDIGWMLLGTPLESISAHADKDEAQSCLLEWEYLTPFSIGMNRPWRETRKSQEARCLETGDGTPPVLLPFMHQALRSGLLYHI